MAINCVIIDDDRWVIEELKLLLNRLSESEINIVAAFDSPSEGLEFLSNQPVDLLFLDIRMPDMNGFELLDRIPTLSSEVIFITSYDEFAIRAIKYSALDYILKPVQLSDLEEAVNRYQSKIEKIDLKGRLSSLQLNLKSRKIVDMRLVIPTKQGDHHFAIPDIVRCEADSNYTVIHSHSKRKFLASKTLGELEELLQKEAFIRIHKSHMINRTFISNITADGKILLTNGETVPISRRRWSEVKRALGSDTRT